MWFNAQKDRPYLQKTPYFQIIFNIELAALKGFNKKPQNTI